MLPTDGPRRWLLWVRKEKVFGANEAYLHFTANPKPLTLNPKTRNL